MATYRYGNPDWRRQITVPSPSHEELEARLRDLLSPSTFANLKTVTAQTRQLRDRVLTLPVMTAIVLSLVYRQVSGLSEVLRILENERVRLVSVLWGQTWHTYLTNVLDPTELSPQQVCDLYCRRWRIEDAFLLTKRLLGLAYLWVGGSNGIQIQLYATWIFSAVLMDLCSQVAVALRQQERTLFCRDGVS
jgi:Transposase DDE domain